MPLSKLYVVTRRDLSPGQQAAQILHAGLALQAVRRDEMREWAEVSNTVVLVSVADEPALLQLQRCLVEATPFYEPDAEHAGGKKDSLTALALLDPPKRLMRDLPKALSEVCAPGGVRTPVTRV